LVEHLNGSPLVEKHSGLHKTLLTTKSTVGLLKVHEGMGFSLAGIAATGSY
jgi:hypothetical protein